MSVIIKDMEMPKTCSQCEIWSKCWDERPFWFERLECCPLTEKADRKTEPRFKVDEIGDDDPTIHAIAHLQKVGWLQEHDRALPEPSVSEKSTGSEKPNNCKVKNYCDDCLYADTCDSKEFFYACTSKATISKMEQVEEPQTEPLPKTINGVKIADAVAWADKWLEDNPVSEMWDMIRTLRDATEWQDEPQTCSVNGRPYSECGSCEHFKCTADVPQTERSE